MQQDNSDAPSVGTVPPPLPAASVPGETTGDGSPGINRQPDQHKNVQRAGSGTRGETGREAGARMAWVPCRRDSDN